MTSKVIKIDSELAVRRIGGLLAKWLQFGVSNDCVLEIEIRKSVEKRRLKQNAAYWAILGDVEKQLFGLIKQTHSKRELDLYFRQKFLGMESANAIGGGVIESVMPHRTLGVGEFSDYLQQVIVEAIDIGVVLHDATNEQLEAAA